MKARLLPESPNCDQISSSSSASLPSNGQENHSGALGSPLKEAAPPESCTAVPPIRTGPQVSPRPTGKVLLTGILIAFLGFIVFAVWSTFLRYRAHGVVTGRVVHVTAPWSANVKAVYVRAGDTVRQGDVLALVSDPDLEMSIEHLADEMRSAQAELDAQVAQLTVAAHNRRDEHRRVLAHFYDLKGRLLAGQSERDELRSKLARRLALVESGVVSSEEIVSLRHAAKGLDDKLEYLTQAVAELATCVEDTSELAINEAALKPWFDRIDRSRTEIRRLREKQRQGTVRAPTAGTVLAIPCNAGEHVVPEQPLIELIQDGSTQVVVFLRQEQASHVQVGETLNVTVEPSDQQLSCHVVRIGDRYEKPPAQLQSYYRHSDTLLPVYLRPPANLPAGAPLRIGASVQVPTDWRALFGISS